MTTGALSGLSVLELGSMVAAPYCAKLLADLGADVVKVEAPGLGDPARRRGPFPDDVPHLERSALFLYLNTSKRGVTLDLGSETGRRIFRDLARDVDVLIEDWAPGELERIGLGYFQLSELNPRLIVTSITPFGQTGPYSRLPESPPQPLPRQWSLLSVPRARRRRRSPTAKGGRLSR